MLTEREKTYIRKYRHWSVSKISVELKQPRHIVQHFMESEGMIDKSVVPIQQNDTSLISALYRQTTKSIDEIAEITGVPSTKIRNWIKVNGLDRELVVEKLTANPGRFRDMTIFEIVAEVGGEYKYVRRKLVELGIAFKKRVIGHDATIAAPMKYSKVDSKTGHPCEALGMSPSEYFIMKENNKIASRFDGTEYVAEKRARVQPQAQDPQRQPSPKKLDENQGSDRIYKGVVTELGQIESKMVAIQDKIRELNNEYSVLGSRRAEIRKFLHMIENFGEQGND